MVALAIAVAWRPVKNHLDAAGFLLRFEGSAEAPAEGIAAWGQHGVRVRDFDWEHGPARLYLPDVDDPPGVVLVHGVHARGIGEARLRSFARAMASTGIAVMTPQVAELTEYRMRPDTIDRFGHAAAALAEHLGAERVGLVGISFSGGLALMAAAQEAQRSRESGDGAIGMVLSVGGHHDLLRVARFYVGEPIQGPDGNPPPAEPHPYGAGVLIHAHVEELFPAQDVQGAREIIGALLHERWREARARVGELSDAGQVTLRAVLYPEDPGRDRLGDRLLEVLTERRDELARISPAGSLSGLEVPVYLIHGEGDPVVPATETAWLAKEVPPDALQAVLVTDALRHAEYGREPTHAERWDLVHFMAQVLGEMRSLD